MRIPSSPPDPCARHLQAIGSRPPERQGATDPLPPQTTQHRLVGTVVELSGGQQCSPVDAPHVASLRAALAEGSYQLQPLATARAVIAARDLLELQS